jgi:endonuclease V-like protein UPF0215 family
MPAKLETRVVGFDDVPFQRGDPAVPVVGVVMRGGLYVEAVLRTTVAGDGDDATARIAEAVQSYRGRLGLGAILLQNLMVAGFNVVDLDALHEATRIPVIAVARGRPDLEAVRSALLGGRVPNGAAKWARIERVAERMHGLDHGRLTMTPVGLSSRAAEGIVRLATVRGMMPEPLRLAHLIGAGWVLGQSKGQ